MVYVVTGKKGENYKFYSPGFGRDVEVGGYRDFYSRTPGLDCWAIPAGSQNNRAYSEAGISGQAAESVAEIRLNDKNDSSHLVVAFDDANIAKVLPCMYQIASLRAAEFLREGPTLDRIKEYCQGDDIHLLIRCEVLFQSYANHGDKLLKTEKMLAKETANIIKRSLGNGTCYGGRYYPTDYPEDKIKHPEEDRFDSLVTESLDKISTTPIFKSISRILALIPLSRDSSKVAPNPSTNVTGVIQPKASTRGSGGRGGNARNHSASRRQDDGSGFDGD